MLQCSLLIEKHCSNSNLKNGDGEVVGVGFWGVFSLKLALKKPLEMLSQVGLGQVTYINLSLKSTMAGEGFLDLLSTTS